MVCKDCELWCDIKCPSKVRFRVGEKKLGRVACPDPWKSGARNTVGP